MPLKIVRDDIVKVNADAIVSDTEKSSDSLNTEMRL